MNIAEIMPKLSEGVLKGAALAAYMVKIMKDLRFYDPAQDPNRDYRINEILPELLPLLEQARKKRGQVYITTGGIDKLIEYQNEDPEKAARYLKWKYLGTMTYKEAFLDKPKPAEVPEGTAQLQDEITQLRNELAALRAAVRELTDCIRVAD